MNDEIEHIPRSHPRATQKGCSYWAPIVSRVTDTKESSKEGLGMADLAESPNAPVETPPV
jgi:hypothetical protein